ncbi:MAG: hypothetical protein IJG84_08115 [Kiritimatiellae bacterium]|nr:hypothetical protein [Kiritimatiellia bacterium]
MKLTSTEKSYKIEKYIAPIGGCNVHNVLDTKDEPIPDGYNSFLDYWEVKSGEACPKECQAISLHLKDDLTPADTTDLVGAHVRIDGEFCPNDQAWIVPLCKHCNRDENEDTILLPEGTVLVPIKMAKEHLTAGQ